MVQQKRNIGFKGKSSVRNLTSAAIVTAVSGSSTAAESVNACHLFTSEQRFVTQTLYMAMEDVRHVLTIPEIYFEDIWDRVNGTENRAQLFRMMMDDFTPVTRQICYALAARTTSPLFFKTQLTSTEFSRLSPVEWPQVMDEICQPIRKWRSILGYKLSCRSAAQKFTGKFMSQEAKVVTSRQFSAVQTIQRM